MPACSMTIGSLFVVDAVCSFINRLSFHVASILARLFSLLFLAVKPKGDLGRHFILIIHFTSASGNDFFSCHYCLMLADEFYDVTVEGFGLLPVDRVRGLGQHDELGAGNMGELPAH